MKRLPVIVLLTLLALGWALVSCGDDSCYDNGSSLPLAAFYMDDNQTTVTGLTIKAQELLDLLTDRLQQSQR